MHSQLDVNCSIYAKSFPKFGKPCVIGYIGLENLKFVKQVKEGRVHFDLNLHIDKAKKKPLVLDVKLTDLLKFLLENERQLRLPMEKNLESAAFFCYRGLLTCLACTPYENNESWKIVAILFKGNIYLCARNTEEKIKRLENMSEKEKLCTSWGFKFEQYILSDTPMDDPNPDQPVDETEEFSLVFTTNLNRHKIIYGAEMDGIRYDTDSNIMPPSNKDPKEVIKYMESNKFLELKTNKHITNGKQDRSFKRFKTKKWWCQSFLVGIDTILCGFRDDDGIVEELKVFTVSELAKMSKKFWDASVCFNFLDTFLTYVKNCLTREIKRVHGGEALKDIQTLPLMSLMFEWTPGSHVHVSENYNHDDDPILLDWFTSNYGRMGENVN